MAEEMFKFIGASAVTRIRPVVSPAISLTSATPFSLVTAAPRFVQGTGWLLKLTPGRHGIIVASGNSASNVICWLGNGFPCGSRRVALMIKTLGSLVG